jgi:hypothetical protein
VEVASLRPAGDVHGATVCGACRLGFGGIGVHLLFFNFIIFDFLFAHMPVIYTFAP